VHFVGLYCINIFLVISLREGTHIRFHVKWSFISQFYEKVELFYVISGFRREVDENYTLLRYYAASSGNFLPTFRDHISVPSSGGKNPNESRCLDY
jgi:hypothetical protein